MFACVWVLHSVFLVFLNKQVLWAFDVFPEMVVPLVGWFCVGKGTYIERAYAYENHKSRLSS